MRRTKVTPSPRESETPPVCRMTASGAKALFSRHLALILLVSAVLIGWSCKSSSPKVQQEPFFSINGQILLRDMPTMPDPQGADVFQAEVDVPLRFEADPTQSAEENYWVIDGLEVSRGSNRLEHVFLNEGMYQVQHCIGPYNCAIRWVNVRKASEVIEVVEAEPESQPVPQPAAPAQKPRKPATSMTEKETDPAVAIEESKPSKPRISEEKAVPATPPKELNPPTKYSKAAVVGFQGGAYSPSCAKWVESASVQLTPAEFCQLRTATVYGNGSGRATITLSDGAGKSESIGIVLTEGRTQFSFADLDAVLGPGRTYTLTVSTKAGQDGRRPGVANISSCGAAPRTSKGLLVNQGANAVFFDIQFKTE